MSAVTRPPSPPRRLRNRLMLAFATFTLFVAALFGLYAVAFMYSVEDEFFDAMLEQEARAQMAAYARDGDWTPPLQPFVRLHRDPATFPDEWRAVFAVEPHRREFPGDDGRHYHVKPVSAPDGLTTAWLVAEVSDQLVVRPIRDRVFWLLAISGLAAIALALLIAWLLARRTTAPLSRLAATVAAMTPERLPRSIARDFGDDEIGTLARGLDALTARIADFIEREQAFTRDASHELRTPLAVIRSAAERLSGNQPGLDADGRRFLTHIHDSTVQLERTVELLLALAREDHAARQGDAPAAPTPVLPILERAVVDQLAALDGGADDIALTVDVPATATLAAPAAVLAIVVANLVGNALRHRDGGAIDIGWRDGRLRIGNHLTDACSPGDPRLRAAFGKREDSPGDGLGLAIVDRLCALHALDLRIDHEHDRVIASIGP